MYIYCTAGQMRIDLGDADGAKELVKKALAMEPNRDCALKLQKTLNNRMEK